jgi:predicted nucleotidyltransferase
MAVRDPFYTLQPRVFVPVVRDALASLKDIQLAFVYGSSVRGNTRADSDIDIMMIGNEEPSLSDMGEALLNMEGPLGRQVDLRFYTPEEFLRKLGEGYGLVPRVMQEPKLWIIGFERQLNTLVNERSILSKAESALGSREKAVAWLSEKNWALGGSRPVHLTSSNAGLQRVERILGRITQDRTTRAEPRAAQRGYPRSTPPPLPSIV